MRQPQDDLTSDLIRVRNGDDAVLTVQEIESIVFSLLMAGYEPTQYLAHYTHRVAISNQRLLALENGQVSFRYKDYQ